MRETLSFLNSEKVVREALLQRHRQFSNRPLLFMMNVLGVQKFSIAFGEYCPIQVQRKRCALRAIHETVFSDLDHFNKIVQDVFKDFEKELFQKGTEIFQPSVLLKMAVSKIMFKFTLWRGSSRPLVVERTGKDCCRINRVYRERLLLALL